MYKLESAAVVEVQMKLRSHWRLLCKFRWQFTREIADQGEQYRWMYRAQRGAQEAGDSCTDGCTDHKERLKRPGRAAQTYVQSTQRRPIGAQEASSWAPEASKTAKLSPRGTQEAPSWAQEAPKRLQVEPKRRPRAPS